MVLTAYQEPIAGKSVTVEILENTVAGGKDVFKGEKHTISHADFLQLSYGNKCRLVDGPHKEELGAPPADVDVEITAHTSVPGKDLFQGEKHKLPAQIARQLVEANKAKVVAKAEEKPAEPRKAGERELAFLQSRGYLKDGKVEDAQRFVDNLAREPKELAAFFAAVDAWDGKPASENPQPADPAEPEAPVGDGVELEPAEQSPLIETTSRGKVAKGKGK